MFKKNIKPKKSKNKSDSISNIQGIAPIWIILIVIVVIGLGVFIVLNLDITKDKKDKVETTQINTNKALTEEEKKEIIKDTFLPLSKAIMKKNESPDSDEDGLSDDKEKEIHKTDPNKADTDDDGLSDWQEIVVYKTDPLKPDTDNDGVNDKEEIQNNTDPKKEGSANGTNNSPLGEGFTIK